MNTEKIGLSVCDALVIICLCISALVIANEPSVTLHELMRKANEGEASAQLALAIEYEEGNRITKDVVKAAAWYEKASEKGLADAQFRLALLNPPNGNEKSDSWQEIKSWQDKARFWLRKAAEQGHLEAQFQLAKMCHPRDASNDDPHDSVAIEKAKWLGLAAQKGHLDAQYEFGKLLIAGILAFEGDGNAWIVPQDREGGMKWLYIAAERNHVEAQFMIGNIFAWGVGVPKNEKEAIRWHIRAAESGTGSDKRRLARMYYHGGTLLENKHEAIEWYRKGAEAGDAESQIELAMHYRLGLHLPKDKIEAYKWLRLACGSEDTLTRRQAMESMRECEQQLTDFEIAEGQRLARSFKPNPPRSLSLEHPPSSFGTGFFISKEGYFVTAAHVVSGAKKLAIVSVKGEIPANLISLDKSNDLALLKVEGQFVPLPIAPSRQVRLGEAVSTIGFPNFELQGRSPKIARGEIAGLSGVRDDPKLFQISVPLQPGNSGGPLFDNSGNVVGVVLARIDDDAAIKSSGMIAENVNYALKSGLLLAFIESLPSVQINLATVRDQNRVFTDTVAEVEQATFMVKASQ